MHLTLHQAIFNQGNVKYIVTFHAFHYFGFTQNDSLARSVEQYKLIQVIDSFNYYENHQNRQG